jgi:hypothetical protein
MDGEAVEDDDVIVVRTSDNVDETTTNHVHVLHQT